MRQSHNQVLSKLSLALGFVVGMEIALGFIMSYAEVPRFAQSLHLLFATVLFCVAGRIYLVTRKSTTSISAIE
jgi:heme A synthase